MHQLVLVDEAISLDNAALLEAMAGTPLPDKAVVVLDGVVERAGSGAVTQIDNSRPWSIEVDVEEFRLGDGRRVVVSRHPDGHFPKLIDIRTRALFNACDLVVARCPARDFLPAVRFYELSLFALSGIMTEASVLAATGFLGGMTDRLRADAARRRHLEHFDPDDSLRPPAAPGDPAILVNQPLEQAEEGVVLETRPGRFIDDAVRLGFEFIDRKVRYAGSDLVILRDGPGISVFGPYVRLDEGRYRLHVELDGRGRNGVACMIEAVWGAGSNTLAAYLYRFEDAVDQAVATLAFEVEGAAAQQPVELRLWTADGSPDVRLTGIQLARVLS